MATNSIHELKILTCIDEASRQKLIDNAIHNVVPAGQQIFREYDVADSMYVIVSGKVSIYITDESEHDIELGILSSDDHFGEQGILTGGTGQRNASARTLEETELMSVSKSVFQSVINENSNIISNLKSLGQNQLRHRLMQESELFRSIHLGVPIQRSLSEASFTRGGLIYKSGTDAKWFYLVLWGVAEVIDNKRLTNKLISPGSFFGEAELINNNLREKTVIAKSELLTLKISGDKFLELFSDNSSFKQLILKKSSGLKPRLVPETA